MYLYKCHMQFSKNRILPCGRRRLKHCHDNKVAFAIQLHWNSVLEAEESRAGQSSQPARCPSQCQQNCDQPHPYVCPAPCCPYVPMPRSQSDCTWQACSLQGNGKEPPLYNGIELYQGSNLGLGYWYIGLAALEMPLHSQIFRQYMNF